MRDRPSERRLTDQVIVVKAKLHRARPQTGAAVVADVKYVDPSHASEKPPNPLEFRKTGFSKGFQTKPLWLDTRLTARHVQSLFGEPTRVLSDRIEYVLQLPTREILKIEADAKGRVSIWGFQKTPTIERWVDRLFQS